MASIPPTAKKPASKVRWPWQAPVEPSRHWYGPGPYLYAWILVAVLWMPFAYLVLIAGYREAMWGVVCLILPITVALTLATVSHVRATWVPKLRGKR